MASKRMADRVARQLAGARTHARSHARLHDEALGQTGFYAPARYTPRAGRSFEEISLGHLEAWEQYETIVGELELVERAIALGVSDAGIRDMYDPERYATLA